MSDVESAYRDYLRAFGAGDLATVAAMLDEDFASSDPVGRLRWKDEYLAFAAEHIGADFHMELHDLQVEPFEGGAVTTGVYRTWGNHTNGHAVDDDIRVIGVWVERDGAWRFTSQQGSFIPKPG